MSNLNFLHSGGNKVTLSAPTSDPSSNPNFKLPQSDGSAGQVLQTDGNGNLSWYTIPTYSQGLSMADIWRISSGGTLGTDTITQFTSNWERADTYGSGQLGSGMTESSGVFTFPSTGIYQVTAMMQFKRNSGENRFADLNIQVTTNNSSYNTAAVGAASFAQDYSTNTAVANLFLDVTNVSTHKVRFNAYTNRSSILYLANSTSNACSFTFLKLGET